MLSGTQKNVPPEKGGGMDGGPEGRAEENGSCWRGNTNFSQYRNCFFEGLCALGGRIPL